MPLGIFQRIVERKKKSICNFLSCKVLLWFLRSPPSLQLPLEQSFLLAYICVLTEITNKTFYPHRFFICHLLVIHIYAIHLCCIQYPLFLYLLSSLHFSSITFLITFSNSSALLSQLNLLAHSIAFLLNSSLKLSFSSKYTTAFAKASILPSSTSKPL